MSGFGADKIATGHYARVRRVAAAPGSMPVGHQDESHATAYDGARDSGWHYQLLKGLDPAKDQSYFLHRLNQQQLSKTLFPVGELHKTEVRRIADEIGLPNAKKKDSTGICFIGERPFREFLNRYIAKVPGPIKSDTGRVIGEHVGLSFYTLGQRQGLGIGGVKAKGADLKAAQARGQRGVGEHEPWFVARKDLDTNILWAVQGHDHSWLQSTELSAQDCSWVAGTPPLPGRLAAKSRYRQADAACELRAVTTTQCELFFDTPQWAVTPGQSAVLYDGEVCLGGGVITGSNVQNVAAAVR